MIFLLSILIGGKKDLKLSEIQVIIWYMELMFLHEVE